MSGSEGAHPESAGSKPGGEPPKVPLTARLLLRESLTARLAAGIIAGFALLITIGGGVLAHLLDRQEYPTIGKGLWFALQTVMYVPRDPIQPPCAIIRSG